MIKAIFWDNDGVLVDTEKLYYKANKEIFLKIGVNLTEEIYIENFLIKSKGTWHLAEKLGLNKEEINEFREKRNRLYSYLLDTELKVISGVEDTLQKLYDKFLMGVVTSSRKDHFEIIHKQTNLLKFFDFTLTSGDFSQSKPNPEPYLKAIEKTGFQKDECLVVEDSERGLNSALKAGLKCFIIPTKLTKNCNFKGADKILNSVSEIPAELL